MGGHGEKLGGEEVTFYAESILKKIFFFLLPMADLWRRCRVFKARDKKRSFAITGL